MSHKFMNCALLIGATALAACGGGSGTTSGNNFVTFAPTPSGPSAASGSNGYASGAGTQPGETYQVNTNYLSLSGTSGPSLQGASATFVYNGPGTSTLVLDGTTYNLTNVGGPYSLNYTTTLNGHTVNVGIEALTSEVVAIYISDSVGGDVLSGISVVGPNTDPANIPASGTASLSGLLYGEIVGAGGTNDVAGTVNFNIDFAASTIDGSGTLADSTTSANLGNFTMPSTAIVGNAFGTTPVVTLTAPGTTVDSAQITGDLFGLNGQEVGGTIAAQGTDANGTFTFLGGFGAD